MRRILLAGVFVAAFGVAPASATLQIALQVGPDSFLCVDNTGCDLNPALGTIEVGDQTIDGIEVNGSIQTSVHGVFPSLSTSSLSLVNTTLAPVLATVAVGDTGYSPVLTRVDTSGSGTWVGPGSSSLSMSWFVDAANTQGADTAFDTPGVQIDTFSASSSARVDSFSHNGPGTLFDLTAPFSMTENAVILLGRDETLLNRGEAMVGVTVPEPSTWAMMLMGFFALGFGALSRKREGRIAHRGA